MSRWACCRWWWLPVDWPCLGSRSLSPGSYAGYHGASEDSLLEPKRANQSTLYHLLHHSNHSPFTQKWTPLSTAGTNHEALWLRRRLCLQRQSRRRHPGLLHLSRCLRRLWKSAILHRILPWRQSPRLEKTASTVVAVCRGRSRIHPRLVSGQSWLLKCDEVIIPLWPKWVLQVLPSMLHISDFAKMFCLEDLVKDTWYSNMITAFLMGFH